MTPSPIEREDRLCWSPRCVLWNETRNICEGERLEGRDPDRETGTSCRYHMTTEEYHKACTNTLSDTSQVAGLPEWVDARINARTSIITSFLNTSKPGHEKEYYQGYLDALSWMLHQTEFPCTGCDLTDCSHHGSSYNCAGNCHTK